MELEKKSTETPIRLVMSDSVDLICKITLALMDFQTEHGVNLDWREVNTDKIASFGAFALDGEELLGGVTFNAHNDWVWIQCGFVYEPQRRQGIYRALLETVERWAKESGMSGIFVSTYDFEAPAVYERLGFNRGAVLGNCPKGNISIDYYKELMEEGAGE